MLHWMPEITIIEPLELRAGKKPDRRTWQNKGGAPELRSLCGAEIKTPSPPGPARPASPTPLSSARNGKKAGVLPIGGDLAQAQSSATEERKEAKAERTGSKAYQPQAARKRAPQKIYTEGTSLRPEYSFKFQQRQGHRTGMSGGTYELPGRLRATPTRK